MHRFLNSQHPTVCPLSIGQIIDSPPAPLLLLSSSSSSSLHLQLCRQRSQNISHWSLWVSSQGKEAPIGCFCPTASYPHISKGPLSSPISPSESCQPSQCLKHKRNMFTLIQSLGDAGCWYGGGGASALGPPSPLHSYVR